MAHLMLAGGTQRVAGARDLHHETLYEEAVAAVLDTSTGALRTFHRHRDGGDVCGGQPLTVGHAFKGIHRDGNHWLLCTERNLLWVDGEGRKRRSWSDPLLNDVHHALRHEGTLWVATTGLDAVLEVRDDQVRGVHPVTPRSGEPGRGIDWRTRSTQPHQVHPNHLFVHNGRVWVTCLHTRDAMEVGGDGHWEVGQERLHDGVLHEGCVWFTTVDGYLVAHDAKTGARRHRIDLGAGSSRRRPLGWCRGLAFTGDVAWVGMTRIRATRWRRNLAFLRGVLRGVQHATRHPTRVVGVRWSTGEVVAEWEVEEVGLHALFGIEVCDPSGAPPDPEEGERPQEE
jgi:hypothetical protein